MTVAACAVALVSLGAWNATTTHARAGSQDISDITVTDGMRSMTVSATKDLDPNAQMLMIRGSGFDVTKGIYVGLCVVQPAGQQPSPCGGGVDKTGSSGSSAWISSNPPAYGVGLAVPYGDNGSFDVEITVSAAINDAVDCRRVECAIVTKSDHTIISDRSQDLIVPVTFSGEAPPAPTSTSEPTSDDSAFEVTVSGDVGDLTDIATSDDTSNGATGWIAVVIGLGVLGALSSIIVVARRKTSTGQGR